MTTSTDPTSDFDSFLPPAFGQILTKSLPHPGSFADLVSRFADEPGTVALLAVATTIRPATTSWGSALGWCCANKAAW